MAIWLVTLILVVAMLLLITEKLSVDLTSIGIVVRSTGSFSVISKSIATTKIRVTSQMPIVFPHRIVG